MCVFFFFSICLNIYLIAVQNKTYNKATGFMGNDIIFSMIHSQWFPTTNKARSDVPTAIKVSKEKMIPLSMVLLTVIGVCALFFDACSI